MLSFRMHLLAQAAIFTMRYFYVLSFYSPSTRSLKCFWHVSGNVCPVLWISSKVMWPIYCRRHRNMWKIQRLVLHIKPERTLSGDHRHIFSSIKLLHTFWYREKNLLPRSTQIIAYRYLISLVTDCPMTDISPIYDKLTNGSTGLDSIVKDLNSVLIKHLVTSFDDQILHISLLLTYKYSWCLCRFIGKLYIKLDQMIMKSRPRLPYFGSKSKPRIVDKRAPPLFSHL